MLDYILSLPLPRGLEATSWELSPGSPTHTKLIGRLDTIYKAIFIPNTELNNATLKAAQEKIVEYLRKTDVFFRWLQEDKKCAKVKYLSRSRYAALFSHPDWKYKGILWIGEVGIHKKKIKTYRYSQYEQACIDYDNWRE